MALWDSDAPDPIEARDDPDPGQRPGHARRLMPLAAQLLERAGWDWSDIQRIVVGQGPGTFTGLRIGIATARALAQSLVIPLTGVSTLESLALGHRRDLAAAEPVVLAVLDARRGEVFAGGWQLGEATLGERLLEPQAMAPPALADLIGALGQTPLAVGDGAIEFRGFLERAGAVVPPDGSELHRVSAAVHCWLARDDPGGAPYEVRPEYLRLPDAELARSRRADAT